MVNMISFIEGLHELPSLAFPTLQVGGEVLNKRTNLVAQIILKIRDKVWWTMFAELC